MSKIDIRDTIQKTKNGVKKMKQDKKVDIIIPVYNAFEYTKKCIETVIANTDLSNHTLVLVNDKSPDEKILPMLKKFEAENSNLNICVIDNEENCGFVKSVNIGMSYSKNDVVLLNSDTEVSKNWLDKMIKTAYLRENIATVTPLSNNATLASVPNFLEENDIPEFVDFEQYAQDIEDCSLELFPEIPTAHGFCMYIKREALERVGLFDDVTFGKGYGEENDFSYRAMQHGYTHVLCDNTLIRHKGTQSFTAAKQELSNKNLQIIIDKYPQNFELTNNFCLQNPIQAVQNNVKYYINNKYRKNILFVVHEFRSRDSKLLGGTVLHIYDLIDNLREKMNIHVLYPENGIYKISSFFDNSNAELILGKINSYENIQMYNYEYKKMLEQIFAFINIDFVHVHHMMHHYFDLFDVVDSRNIPYALSLHDLYMICPLLTYAESVDNFNTSEEFNFEGCLKELESSKGNFVEDWKNKAYEVLKKAKKIVAPSNSPKGIFEEYYGDLNIDVIEHGVEKVEENYEAKNFKKRKNIAFIGGINKTKGLEFFKELVGEVNKKESKYTLHLFGTTSEDKYNQSNGNYVFHGKYNREDIIQLLKENNIHLVCLFSIWPETYSYTLTESLMAEIPVLVIDYGALSERTKKDNLGWVLDKKVKVQEIIEKIHQIFDNEKEYETVKNQIKNYLKNLKTVDKMAEEYEKMYEQFIHKQVENYQKLNKQTIQNILEYSKQIGDMNQRIKDCDFVLQNEVIKEAQHNERIAAYHHTVTEYKKEIDRLNEQIAKYQAKEETYNQLMSSKRLKLLKKIRFIKF